MLYAVLCCGMQWHMRMYALVWDFRIPLYGILMLWYEVSMLCYCMVCVVKDMHKLTLDHLGIDLLLIFCEWLLIYNFN